jgi:hypothetical protein
MFESSPRELTSAFAASSRIRTPARFDITGNAVRWCTWARSMPRGIWTTASLPSVSCSRTSLLLFAGTSGATTAILLAITPFSLLQQHRVFHHVLLRRVPRSTPNPSARDQWRRSTDGPERLSDGQAPAEGKPGNSHEPLASPGPATGPAETAQGPPPPDTQKQHTGRVQAPHVSSSGKPQLHTCPAPKLAVTEPPCSFPKPTGRYQNRPVSQRSLRRSRYHAPQNTTDKFDTIVKVPTTVAN